MAELTEEEVKNLFDEFKRVLRKGGAFSAEPLNTMIEIISDSPAVDIPDHTFLTNLRDAAENTASISDYLFIKYKSAEMQPAEGEGGLLPELYSLVEKELDNLLENEIYPNYDLKRERDRNYQEVWELIVLSAELWFLWNLRKCKHNSVKQFIESNAVELFHEFFGPIADEDDPRFEVLAENDCVDIMEKILCDELGVSSSLQKYLEDKDKARKLCQNSMSQKMIKAINPHSKKFYIIPRPRENFAKMYGFVVNGFFTLDETCYSEARCFEAEQRAVTSIEDAFKIVKIQIIDTRNRSDIFKSENLFSKLREWVEGELSGIKNGCSLLVLTVLCHGIYGHLTHNVRGNKLRMEIEKLFISFGKFDGLKGIPKVGTFAC